MQPYRYNPKQQQTNGNVANDPKTKQERWCPISYYGICFKETFFFSQVFLFSRQSS